MKETVHLQGMRLCSLKLLCGNRLNTTNPLREIYWRMKLTLVISLFSIVHLLASPTLAQNINLHGKQMKLEQVLKAIKQQSGYNFVYNNEVIALAMPVDIDVTDVALNKVLEAVFERQPITYSVRDKIIVLKRKEGAPVDLERNRSLLPTRQQKVVLGSVSDARTGKPVIGANVSPKGYKGTSTNKEGKYAVVMPAGINTIVVSYVGYKRQEVKVSLTENTTVVNVKLEEDEADLGEVVVTGIFKKPTESFTGASTTVTGEELQQHGTRNLITSLRNIDPSFNIVESNVFGSNPNRLPEIQLRGNSNIPNINELQDETRVGLNTPLIILDGFQSTLQKMLDINENEIETITILKDASATAIYGSRGANGVVVITTKSPKVGKLRVNYRSDINLELPDLSAYSLLNARDKLDLEWRAGYYNNARAESDLPLKRYYNYLMNEINSGVETDWMALPLRNGIGQRHNVRLEGGSDHLRYSASAQLNDIKGVMKESGRRTFNGNITLTFTYDKVQFRNNLQVAENKSAESPYGTFSDYVRMNPYWRVYDEDGNVLRQVGYPGNTDYVNRWTTLPTNPYYNGNLNTFDENRYSEITNNSQFEWSILSGLTARVQFGITKIVSQSDRFRPAEHTAFVNYSSNDIFRKGDYRYGIGNNMRYDGSVNLQYVKSFKKHTLFGGVDYNIRQANASEYTFLVEGFNNPNFDFVSMALQYAQGGKPGGSESLTRAVGITGNVSYIYDNRYFVDGAMRLDGASQFGSKQRYAPFWSTGIGWNLHNESFMSDARSWVNRLKLRGSMGITGSQNFDAYQAQATYQYYTDDRYFNWNGAYLIGLGNENLRWQQTMKYDIGIDAEFLHNRLKLVADYYIETTEDLVSSVNLPASSGFANYVDNIGRLRNKGIEVKLTAVLLNKPQDGWFWSVTGAAVQNRNSVLETSQALKDAQASIQNATGNPGMLYVEGYSSNAIWVVPSLGIDPSTGKELYLDDSGQPTYTWNGAYVRAVGTTDPTFFGNFNTMLRYKSLSLNASFGYRFGGQQYNQTLVDRVETGNYNYNVDERVYYSRWQQPGDIAAFKGLLVTGATYKTSRFVQDENMLQCQNINLQYNVANKDFLHKLRISSLLISANMADAFYISTIRRERGTSYPFARQFSLNFNAIF